MTITRTYRVVTEPGREPDLSYERFRDELLSWNSPILDEASTSYDALRRYPVSILALVAMAMHDSGLSTAGINVTHNTKNPGNTRTCVIYDTRTLHDGLYTYYRNGVEFARQIRTPKGVFVQFDRFSDGWADMAYRLVKPDYVYAQVNAKTLEQIVPIYAPTSDGNSPENYINSTIRYMERLRMGPDRYSSIDNIPVVWIPAPPTNYASGHGPYELIVIHSIEGSAESGIATLSNPARRASTHFITDPDRQRIVQMVGTRSEAWTSGDYKGNRNGLNIENPGFAGRPFDPRVVAYCGRLCGVLARDFGIPLIRLTPEQANTPGVKGICGHGDLEQRHQTNKHWDPGPTWPWEEMLNYARNVAGGGDPPLPGDWFPETGFGVLGGIAASWRDHGGVSGFGYPISWEYDTYQNGKRVRVQWFERGRAEWSPGREGKHNVTWGLLGSEILEMMRHIQNNVALDYNEWLDDIRTHPWAFVPGRENWPKKEMYPPW